MATHSASDIPAADDRTDWRGGSRLFAVGALLAAVGLVLALALGYGGRYTLRPFLFAYLVGFVFVLAIALGCLVFVLLQHLTRAAWSVGVRRVAENYAATLPVLALFSLPIILSVAMQNGYLYRWALPMSRATPKAIEAAEKGETEEEPSHQAEEKMETGEVVRAPVEPASLQLDPLVLIKRNYGLHWLNPWFFIGRIVLYFFLWSGVARWYRRMSIAQDATADESLTLRMQNRAAPCLIVMGLTMTGLAIDLMMTLDPHWYSTMFGVHYIANCFLASYATLIITFFLLQRAGYLRRTLTIEHYHDLGKYLFGFTFFYGYIAFAQYMLIWYANLPEETEWFGRHGASTIIHNGWNAVIILVLIGHFLIPFPGLLSRHVKRNPTVLTFWAVWQLVFVAVDMYWIITPESGLTGPTAMSVLLALATCVGLGGVLLAAFGRLSSGASIRPTHDPRLADSLAFQNI